MDAVFNTLSCDSSLPLSIVASTFSLTCNGQRRCSFLGDYALAEGQYVLSGVQDTGMENGEVYVSGYIDTESSTFEIRKVMVDLCNYAIDENLDDDYDGDGNNNNQCQLEDGTYNFSMEFSIPQIDSRWGDTGWMATGQLFMHTYKGEQVGSCEASFRTLSEFGPSAKTVFLVLMPLVGVGFFILTYLALRRAIRNNLCCDDMTDKSEGVTTTAFSVSSDCSIIASDSSSPMKPRGSKPSRDEGSEKGITTAGVGGKSGKKVKELEIKRVKSDPPDGFEEAMLRTHKKRIGKEVKISKSPSHLDRVRFTVMDKVLRRPSRQKVRASDDDAKAYHRMEEANIKSTVVSASSPAHETTAYQPMEEANSKSVVVTASSPANETTGYQRMEKANSKSVVDTASSPASETTAYQRMEKANSKSVVDTASSPANETTAYQRMEKANTKSAVVTASSPASETTAYQRMEKANTKSAVVTASSPANETTAYQRMEKANTKSAVISTSSATDESKVYQHMEEADTKSVLVSAFSATPEIKANHLVEEANTKSAVVSASSAAHETKAYPLMEHACTKTAVVYVSSAAHETKANPLMEEACTKAAFISVSSAAHKTNANHLTDETNTKSAVDSASSVAHETKAYQRTSKDKVKAAFTQNEQAVLTSKNDKFQRIRADLASVGEDIAAMGGDMMSSFADAFSELTTSKNTERKDAALVGNSERRVASRSPPPKKGKRMISDDNSSVQAVALGRQGLTQWDDITVTNSIVASTIAASVADKAESPA